MRGKESRGEQQGGRCLSPLLPSIYPCLYSPPAFLHLPFLSATCPSTLIQPQIPTWVETPPWPFGGQLQDTAPSWQPVPEQGHPPKDGAIQLEAISW